MSHAFYSGQPELFLEIDTDLILVLSLPSNLFHHYCEIWDYYLVYHNSTKHAKSLSIFLFVSWVTTGLFLAHLLSAEITYTETNMPSTCN